ncbi:MAG: diguanylate cyclase response regulator [Acidobacteria bacterium]|nr:MAG: diguanylate cyclase response regulator [Acidobacteriota bacterium]
MKILIAEDETVSRRLLQNTLVKWGYEVVVCRDGQEAWEGLQTQDAPQLAILDWMMPKMDGLLVCKEIRKQSAEPYVYILLLTSKSQKEDLITGLEAGADDYLTKPFDAPELKAKLRAGMRILDLQTELINAREALRVQATQDPLTGLWNRGAILEALRREIARAKRERNSVAVVMADLDHFKRINDSYGHLAGDAALRQVADRMRSSIRPYDAIGRYGGEEFLILLPGCNIPGAATVAERLMTSIAGQPVDLAGEKLLITCSLGVASNSEAPEADADWLIRAADAALYQAKSAGRDRVEFALKEMEGKGRE